MLFLRQATLLKLIDSEILQKLYDNIVGHKYLDYFSLHLHEEEDDFYRKHEIRNIRIRGNDIVKQLLEAAFNKTECPKYERKFTDLLEFG